MRKGQPYKKSPSKPIDLTIDEILQHHYFLEKITSLVQHKAQSYINGNQSFSVDRYMIQEKQLVSQFSDIICLTVQQNLRKVLNEQFIDVVKEVQDLKQQMYLFMEEQNKLTSSMKQELDKGLEEIRRKNTTEGIVNNIIPNRGNSVKLMRSNLKSNLEGEKRSQYSEMVQLKKQLQLIKQQHQKGQNLIAITEQFHEFKIQTKVSIEGLKHQIKKITGENYSVLNEQNKTLTPTIRDTINDTVKRSLKSQLSVYGNYAEQVSTIKQQMEKMEDSIERQQVKSQDYFSTQLKSVWLVLNDVKKSVDFILQHLEIPHSEII